MDLYQQLTPQQRSLATELLRRQAFRKAVRAELFDLQLEVLDCPHRYISVTCGRRSGKTSYLVRHIALALESCGPNEHVGYATQTKGLGKTLIWQELKDLLERHGLNEAAGWRVLENETEIHTPRGGHFKIYGFDSLPELEKVRGLKFRLFAFDEIATVAKQAKYIVEESLGPALMDLSGKLIVCGTPGKAKIGWWYEVSTGLHPRFKKARFHWTVRQNKKFPRDPEIAIQEELDDNGWTPDHPAFMREILGIWVSDPNSLVFGDYNEIKNKCPAVPYDLRTWTFGLGIDYGVADPCGWVVVGMPPDSPVGYVLETRKQTGLTAEKASQITKDLVLKYKPVYVVGDGAATSYILDFNERWAHSTGVWVEPAYKPGKVGQIDIVNAQLRLAHLILSGSHPELEEELTTLLWADEERTITPKKGNDHLCDGLRYLLVRMKGEHRAPPPEKPADPLADFDARAARELEREASDESYYSYSA